MHGIQLGIFFIKYQTFFRLQNLIDNVSKIIFVICMFLSFYYLLLLLQNKNIVVNWNMQFQDHLSEDV